MKKDFILMQSKKRYAPNGATDDFIKDFDEVFYDRFIKALNSQRVRNVASSFVAIGTKKKGAKEVSLSHFYFDRAEELKDIFPYAKDRSQTIMVQNDSDVLLFDYTEDALYKFEICAVKKSGKVVPIGKETRKAFGYFYGKLYSR